MAGEVTEYIKLKTGVSQTFWCKPDGDFQEASIPNISMANDKDGRVSWFDNLLEGGISVPREGGRPITFLLTGPPGSGKSTLALEICYRLARNTQLGVEGLFTLYLSTEADAKQVRDKAMSFGWEDVTGRIISLDKDTDMDRLQVPAVAIWSTDKVEGGTELSHVVKTSIEVLATSASRSFDAHGSIAKSIDRIFNYNAQTKRVEKVRPDIVVVDSLNIVEPANSAEYFKQFLEVGAYGPRLIFFILDSGHAGNKHEFWEYVCDNVIRMDYDYTSGYYLRSIEVVKARYQSHVWGKHQIKIYPPNAIHDARDSSEDKRKRMRRAHPYRKEGGIFIYPSIHYYLSRYKRQGPTDTLKPAATPLDNLNKMLAGGLPAGRCTALIGARGGHKSHLGYLHLLHRIIKSEGKGDEDKEKGLIISLRDDEGMTETTIKNILKQQFKGTQTSLENLIESDRLEILYYPPGNITPEEFFHRMFMSVHRLKREDANGKEPKLTVLFNSLDQLSARFPLCADEKIFVPAIIESLSAERITSIFVAVDEPGQPAEQYGLLPMSDLILSFGLKEFASKHYFEHIEKARKEAREKILHLSKDGYHSAAIVKVIRYAGGKRAGDCGLLELVDEDELTRFPYQEPGLHFTPLHPGIPFR